MTVPSARNSVLAICRLVMPSVMSRKIFSSLSFRVSVKVSGADLKVYNDAAPGTAMANLLSEAKKAAGYYTPEPPKAEDLKTSGRPLEKY